VKKRRAVGEVVGARGVSARELVMGIAMGEGRRGEEDDMAVGDHWGVVGSMLGFEERWVGWVGGGCS